VAAQAGRVRLLRRGRGGHAAADAMLDELVLTEATLRPRRAAIREAEAA
jgi:hypothetical protein